jgi:hypothetical protein
VATRRTRFRSSEEEARRSALAHVEHVRSLGEALTKAANTYIAGQEASQAESENGWREDLATNLGDAVDEFHRSLAEAPKRILDVYNADLPEPKPTSKRTAREAAE